MENDQTGDQRDNLRLQVQHFDELLDEQQNALRDWLASPLGTKDEDDDLADELEDLARSEELLRQELTKVPLDASSEMEPNNHESVGPINNSHSHTSAKSNVIGPIQTLRRTTDRIPGNEEVAVVFYREKWDDELFRGHGENDLVSNDAFESAATKNFFHDAEGYDDIKEAGWNVSDLVPGPVKESPDRSKAELDMMLATDRPALPAIDEKDRQTEKRQKISQTEINSDKVGVFSGSAAILQPNMVPVATPQKERQEMTETNELSFSTAFAMKTPSPSKEYSMSITPQSTDAPTPTRAPSPLKNSVAKLFGKASRPREENSPITAPLALKRPWFARTSPPVAVKIEEPIARAQTKTPPSKSISPSFQSMEREDPGRSVERISTGSAEVSTPTLVSILQNTMAFNPLEQHHEQVLGSLMLSPENIVFESSDDDTYDKSIEHARKNLDSALEGKLPVEGSTSLASGGFPDGPETPPPFSGYPGHVRKPSLGDRELPQRWTPASSSEGSKALSPDRCNAGDLETNYVRASPAELYPEFDFYAPKSESLVVTFANTVKETQLGNASGSSALHSFSDSASYDSAVQEPTANVSFDALSGSEAHRSEARSIGSVDERLTKASSSASQSFVTAMDDTPFSGSVSVKTISSGDASHLTYATAREQEEESCSLVTGQIKSVDSSMDYEIDHVEDGIAPVESTDVPSKELQTYRNSDSDSETSRSQAHDGRHLSCLQVVKKLFSNPIPVLLAVLVTIAVLGISIRLIMESTRGEDSAMIVPRGNFSAPSLSPTRIPFSPMPSLAPLLGPTASPVSATMPDNAPLIDSGVAPTVQLSGSPPIIPTTRPFGESLSPTLLPNSVAPSILSTDLVEFLSSVSFDNGTALRNASTPQYAAYRWLSGNEFLPSYFNDRIIQRYALATLYFSTDGDGWTQKTGWLSDSNECLWYMRSSIGPCDLLGLVVSLDLDYNDIGGSIPPEIGLLSHLKLLDLGGGPSRQLSGSIPTEIGNMKSLQKLYLPLNKLSGTLPTEMGTLSDVNELLLKGNNFRGTIPSEIGNMRNAKVLDLSNNILLVGDLPASLGNLTSLQSLLLGNNTLVGAVPSEIGNLVGLQTLSLAGNQITGIPSQIGSLVALTALHLDRNGISGSMPSGIHLLSNLRYLTLSENKFNSTIPSTLGNLSNLTELDLSMNMFSGSIPSELGDMNSRLRVLKMNGNFLTGSVPKQFSHLDRINTLALHDNLLVGTVPYTVCRVFEWIIPSFSVDCEEVDCPCCIFLL